jgi:hypothetical protein
MPTLENDRLVFRFPATEPEAAFAVDFQRTLRIPDSDKTYPLPPGLGRFPLRHAEDYPRLPAATRDRGGVVLPIWQAEALWLNFSTERSFSGPDFPVAIKVAAGKINAVSGEPWQAGLRARPQDYMVAPGQPWLDGYSIGEGVVRQFVAMPLGEGYSAEEQLNGAAEWGGLQIAVMPLKAEVWAQKKARWEERLAGMRESAARPSSIRFCLDRRSETMALAPGGRMRQVIHDDPYGADCWDTAAAQRVFVTLLHGKDWKQVTGERAPDAPPGARDYSKAGLPWFKHYGLDQRALPGSRRLAGLTSLARQFKRKTGATLPGSQDVNTAPPTPVGPGKRPVSSGRGWE